MMIKSNWITFDIETLGLDSINNQITCISALDNEGNKYSSVAKTTAQEHIILKNFLVWCLERPTKILVTKNGKKFDVPYIVNRCVMTGLISKVNVLKNIISIFNGRYHIDVQEITKKWVTLEDMATLMNLGHNKTMTGLQQISIWKNANKLLLQGDSEKAQKLFMAIKEYCEMDVLLTAEIAIKHKLINIKLS